MRIPLLTETDDAQPFFADAEWCAQEKADGVRCLLIRDAKGIRGVSRQSRPLKLTASILAQASAMRGHFILDGELLPGGWFIAFDVQRLANRYVSALPMIERFDLLAGVPFARVRCAFGEDDKRALLASVRAEGGEGLVFKRMAARCRDGRDENAVRFKLWQRETFTVADVFAEMGTVGLLINGRECGRCVFPLNSPWPRVGDAVEVRFAKWTVNGKLAQPVYLGIRRKLAAA